METTYSSGDVLVYQIESGFGIIRILEIDVLDRDSIWHITAFGDFFPDVESAEGSIKGPTAATVSIPHVALTERAFESTQVSRIGNSPITETEIDLLRKWHDDPNREISDRSVRLMLGIR